MAKERLTPPTKSAGTGGLKDGGAHSTLTTPSQGKPNKVWGSAGSKNKILGK